jgi:hypothetical protein
VSGLWDSGRRYLSRVTSTRSTGAQQHYSRQDFMEQYCVTPTQLKTLDKIANAVNNHQGGGLFGCLSNNQQVSISPSPAMHLRRTRTAAFFASPFVPLRANKKTICSRAAAFFWSAALGPSNPYLTALELRLKKSYLWRTACSQRFLLFQVLQSRRRGQVFPLRVYKSWSLRKVEGDKGHER